MNYLTRSRSIHDGLYGLIKLTPEEMGIIDHPLFQRQRSIHQTGLLRYVFPTATNTRFEHCIGVVHMTQSMLDAVSSGSRAASSKLRSRAQAEPGQAIKFHELDAKFKATLQRVARILALVHDLGHGPLSHAYKRFAPKLYDVEPLLDDPRLDPLRPYRAELFQGNGDRISHEAATCLLFAVLWSDNGGDDEYWMPSLLAAVMLNARPHADVPEELRPWVPFLRDLISSAPVDADRMDYMLRDSRACGVSYGLYEPNRILKSVLCVRGKGADLHAYRLGWRMSSLRAIENFVQARFQMFAQIYRHKTLRAIELMMDEITRKAGKSGACVFKTATLDGFVEGYLRMSDESFLKALMEGLGSASGGGNGTAELARRIVARDLWKRLYEFGKNDDDLARHVLDVMSKAYPDERFIVDRQPLKAMRDLERGAYLLSLDEEGKYACDVNGDSWLEASPIMRTLKEEEESVVRLFFGAKAGGADPRAVRAKVLELVHQWRAP
ncbi:MAG: hypothetical protein RDU25_03670 [Patescibacteria group bacterium]|nr:hypothetical protein [Patescibacteria group bacterium]